MHTENTIYSCTINGYNDNGYYMHTYQWNKPDKPDNYKLIQNKISKYFYSNWNNYVIVDTIYIKYSTYPTRIYKLINPLNNTNNIIIDNINVTINWIAY
jgi:hypothetical protein